MQDETIYDTSSRKRQRQQQQYNSDPLLSSPINPVGAITTTGSKDEDDDKNIQKYYRFLTNKDNKINNDTDWYDTVYSTGSSDEFRNNVTTGTTDDDKDNNNHHQEDDNNTVRSSWMKTSVQWISSSQDLHVHATKEDTTTTPNNNNDNNNNHESIITEINYLFNQLSLMKERLSPVADHYCTLYNKYYRYDNSNNKIKTNPSIVFTIARKECNPYESLTERNCCSTKKQGWCNFHKNMFQNECIGCLFLNRAAIKLANIDAILKFQLTKQTVVVHHQSNSVSSSLQSSIPNNTAKHSITTCTTGTSTIASSTCSNTIFSFVDLCSAPGGFSEYIIWRIQHDQQQKQQQSYASDDNNTKISQIYGFAMSLVGSNEQGYGTVWKLKNNIPDSNEHCHDNLQRQRQYNKRKKKKHDKFDNHPTVHYEISNGADGTGDIYNWENVQHLQSLIKDRFNRKKSDNDMNQQQQQQQQKHPNRASSDDNNYKTGSSHEHVRMENNNNNIGKVQLVLADGGFDAQRDNTNQEEISTKIIVYQIGAALLLLQSNGTLVLKMFGFQTTVIRTVLQYLYISFTNITVVKPISSRPASAERYLIATGFYGNTTTTGSTFDGLKWCSEMLLCSTTMIENLNTTRMSHTKYVPSTNNNITSACTSSSTTPNDMMELIFAPLYEYIDTFDRNMLSLNLKACCAIVSNLEYKCKMLQEEYSTTSSIKIDDDNDDWDEVVDEQNNIQDSNYSNRNDEDVNKNRYNFVAKYKHAWRLD